MNASASNESQIDGDAIKSYASIKLSDSINDLIKLGKDISKQINQFNKQSIELQKEAIRINGGVGVAGEMEKITGEETH